MTVPWSESSTWNSLAGGIDVGVDTDPALVAFFHGDNATAGTLPAHRVRLPR